MSAMGPGDWVECVDVSPRSDPHWKARHDRALSQLRLGRLYRCVGPARVRGVLIEGIRAADEPNCGWAPWRFRPIYRPKADLIESLLQGIDQLVPDDSERANARLSSPSPIAGCNPLEKASFIEASGARSSSFKQFRASEITQPVHRSALLAARLERGEP